MLKIICFILPFIKKLVEINRLQKELIDNLEKEKQYNATKLVHPQNSWHAQDPEYIRDIAKLWEENPQLQWFMYQYEGKLQSKFLKSNEKDDDYLEAEIYKHKIRTVKEIIHRFEEYVQIREAEETKGNPTS